MGEENPVGVGYTKFEVMEVCDQVVHEEGGLIGLNLKTEPPSSVVSTGLGLFCNLEIT
jgi:hypothetical protein